MRHRHTLGAADHGEVAAHDHRSVERRRVRACHAIGGANYRRGTGCRGGADEAMTLGRQAVDPKATGPGAWTGVRRAVQTVEGDSVQVRGTGELTPYGSASARIEPMDRESVRRLRLAPHSKRGAAARRGHT